MENFLRKKTRNVPQIIREMLAEMLGTFMILIFGVGCTAQFVLGKGLFGSWLSLNFGWGFGVMLGLYCSAGVSGGHLNPAVTFAMALFGRISWKKVIFYWLGQMIGAFLASCIAYGVYYDLLVEFEGTTRSIQTAGIWSTYPAKGVSNATVFGDQVLGTALLLTCVFALTDKKNNPPSPQMLPLLVGLVVVAIGISFGINVGYGINPARDLVPRIFTALAGWHGKPFEHQHYFFWIPIAGQFVGAVIGALVYLFIIELHHPIDENKKYNDVQITFNKEEGTSKLSS